MNNQDLLKILESFPGKKVLKKSKPTEIEIPKVDFLEISKYIKEEEPKLTLGKEEDLWVKYIVFENFALDDLILRIPEEEIWNEENILSPESRELSRLICHNVFNRSKGKIEIFVAAAIELDELHDFLQKNNLF